MAGLPVRHSPGMTRREPTRDARCMGEMRFLQRLLLKFVTVWNSRKAHAVSVLLRFDFRDSRGGGNFHTAVVIPR